MPWLRSRARLERDSKTYASLSEEKGIIEEGSPVPDRMEEPGDRMEEPGYEIELPRPPKGLPLFVL